MDAIRMNKLLSEHIIANIEFKLVKTCYPRLHGKNAVKTYHGFGDEIPIAVLKTNHGEMGWGILCRGLVEATDARPLLVGKKVSDLISADQGVLDDRITSYDIALHDLAGKILGIPVAKMLNPAAVKTVEVYDGAIYMNDIIPEDKPQGIESILQDCTYDWEKGYRTFKIKIGRGHRWMNHDEGLKRDIEVVKQIHNLYPGAGLMVDANDGYSVEDAISFMKGIEGISLIWFEEPFLENQNDDEYFHRWLDINRPRTMIADGENKPDVKQLLSLAKNKVLDVLQPDVCGYGFTNWRKLMLPIVENGFLASPHAWGDVIKTYYCAHLAAAYTHNVPCIEGILGYTEGIDHTGYTIKDGVLSLPDKPGFGMDFIWGKSI